jgi:hypothetical protein
VGAQGDAIVTWQQFDPSRGFELWANAWMNIGGWRGAQRLLPLNTRGSGSAVALDATGNGFALWEQIDGLWASRFERQAGWGPATRLDTMPVSSSPGLGIDAQGRGLAVWTRSLPPGLWFSRSAATSR